MKRLTLAALLALRCASASAQIVDGAALRHALSIDPFAITPYRLLVSRLTPPVRAKLLQELQTSGHFADEVLAARLQLDSGQVAAAREQLHRGIAQLPGDARSLDAFAQLALSAGAYVEAAQAAQAALKQGRTPPRLAEAAIAELRQGKRADGLALLDELRKKDATGVAADAALDALIAQRLLPDAVELLRAQLEAHVGAGSATQWKQLGDLERQLGHAPQASDALLHALDAEPTATGRRAISQAILRLHREKKSLPDLQRTLRDGKTAPRLLLRGDLEAELGHANLALASYEAAAKLAPTDAEPALRLAALTKSPSERADRYAALVASHPNELRYALELADLRFATKDDAAGKKTLRDAAQRLASAPEAQDQLARRLAEHGDPIDALVCRQRAATLDLRNVEAAFALGDAYRALDDKLNALAAYSDAVKRADGNRSAWDRELDALERAGYDDEANVRYAEMRKRWPADAALVRRYAAALEHQVKTARAIAVWQEIEASARQPFEREQAHYNIHRLQLRQMSER